ncbi:MAG: carbonic anhydrase [Vulcanimicrobiota bacterium]
MKKKVALGLLGAGLILTPIALNPHVQFVTAGALINVGYCLQDHLHAYDLSKAHELDATQVWDRFCVQNRMASKVRDFFPRTRFHPLVALVVCMDARLDTNELAGDTRRYYYIVRTAGSVLDVKEEEMLELAVEKGVKVIVFTTHSDCAAEKAAKDPALCARFPKLTSAVGIRMQRFEEFKARPMIAEKIKNGELLVHWAGIHTGTDGVDDSR